ncbi:uncharacterized protein METZ01_LOCUS104925 [marine metagenome]|uniref:Major facilitator superfamily (MFS) profile domain-containing protein n=1 Tax=marine metagenome TaxID=408172 RepID=A0A381WIE6_9ZZZZ
MVKIFYWSAAVSIGGFLFGFDTAVISGADQPLQQLWKSSDIFHGALIMSSALWGTVVGALSGNIPTERLGRKKTLIIVGTLYFVSAIGSALSVNPYFFFIMRFIGGIGVGISSIVVPAYIAEISPAKYRGRLVALYQFQIVFGILVAFLSNFLLSEFVGLGWRWMLGIEVIPALIFLLLVTNVPESPRWLLLRKNEIEKCRDILSISHPNDVDCILDEIQESREEYTQENLFSRPYFFPILLAFLLALFNQMSGINFVIYFAPRVFSLAGLDSSAALLSSAGIGLVNLISTLLGILLIDRVGRKKLMLIGSIGYIISLSAVSWAFFSNADGMIVVFFIFLFIASHAIGQGAVIWVYIAEIFPNNVRAKGQSMGCGTHWVAAAVITLLMPYFLSRFEAYGIFGFFGAIMILQLLFVIFVMPETKGKSLESVSQELYKRG